MYKLRNFIALYFTLSRKESNGFFVLCGFMLVIIFTPSFYKLFSPPPSYISASDKKSLDSIALLLEATNQKKISTYYYKSSKANDSEISYSDFMPNTSSEEEMIKAGVPEFISKRIIKFRSKGGKFKMKEDLQKIYGISSQTYEKLYPYIIIEEKTETRKSFSPSFIAKKTIQSFDINLADSSQLVSLKGIGPTFAGRIIKYRNKLGGLISMGQLKEVYGLDSLALGELSSCTYIKTDFVPERININSPNFASSFLHPYLGKKNGQLILNYRNQHGNFSSVEQLKNIKPISEQVYNKLLPYLFVE